MRRFGATEYDELGPVGPVWRQGTPLAPDINFPGWGERQASPFIQVDMPSDAMIAPEGPSEIRGRHKYRTAPRELGPGGYVPGEGLDMPSWDYRMQRRPSLTSAPSYAHGLGGYGEASDGEYVGLEQLPLPGLQDFTQPAWRMQDLWAHQLWLIDQIRNAQLGYGMMLSTRLDSLRYWIAMALAQLERYKVMGMGMQDPAVAVEGLAEALKGFLYELPKTRAAWSVWAGGRATTQAQARQVAAVTGGSTPRQVSGYYGYGGFGAETGVEPVVAGEGMTAEQLRTLQEVARARTPDEYGWALGLGGVLLFLSYALSR